MPNRRTIPSLCAALALTACGHVRLHPPVADGDEAPPPSETQRQDPSPAAAPVGPTDPCKHAGRNGVGAGIGGVLRVVGTACTVGGPITATICAIPFILDAPLATGVLVSVAALGGVIGGAVGTSSCRNRLEHASDLGEAAPPVEGVPVPEPSEPPAAAPGPPAPDPPALEPAR